MLTACSSWPLGQKIELLGWKHSRRYSSLWNMWLSHTETRVWETWIRGDKIGAKRTERTLVSWQVVLAKQICGICYQHYGNVMVPEVT